MRRLLFFLVFFCAPLAAAAQDAAKVDPEHYKVILEDGRVRILKVTLKPGERARSHSHPPGSVVFLTRSKATFSVPYAPFGTHEVEAGDTFKLEARSNCWPDNSGPDTFEALIIEVKRPAEVKADAKPGETALVCNDRVVPADWVVVDLKTDFAKCGTDFDNAQEIKNTKGLPEGTELSVCKDSPVPEGWEVVGTTTDFTKCGRGSSFDNLKKIKRQP